MSALTYLLTSRYKKKMIAAALLAAASLPLAAAFGPCCAFNGQGDAVLLGTGVLNAFAPASGSREPTGPAYAAPMAVGVSGAHQFTTILFGARTGPEDAVAGWVVTSNATNDVIFMFSNVTGTPQCAAGVGPKGSMVPEYGLCGGSGLFPQHDHDYKVAGLAVGVFVQQSQSGGASSACAEGCLGSLPHPCPPSCNPLTTHTRHHLLPPPFQSSAFRRRSPVRAHGAGRRLHALWHWRLLC